MPRSDEHECDPEGCDCPVGRVDHARRVAEGARKADDPRARALLAEFGLWLLDPTRPEIKPDE